MAAVDAPTPEHAASGGPAAWARTEGSYFLEILAVSGFAFAQPVLDVFGRDPATFIAAGAGRAGIVAFALTVILLPAGASWAVAALTRPAGPAVRHAAQVGVLGGWLLVFAHTEITRATGWPRPAGWGASLTLALGFAALYLRVAPTRTFLRFASAGSAVFLVLFLAASPVASLLRPSATSSAPAPRGDGAPVLWVVFDELPTASLLDGKGAIDAQLFPHFAALARDATWYRNNTTVSAFTEWAVPALLTGLYPADGDVPPTVDHHPRSAFTLLGNRPVNALEPLTRLCPVSVCGSAPTGSVAHTTRTLLRQAWRVWRDRAAGLEAGASDAFEVDKDLVLRSRGEDFRHFADRVASEPRRPAPFDFAHVVLPHTPLEFLPNGKRYDQERDGFFFGWLTPDAARIGRQRHLLQVQLADRCLGELMAALRRKGTYAETLIVVTSDHGAAFRAHEKMRGFTRETLTDVAFSPLLIKAPHQARGTIDDRNSETIDVLPTVADLLGLDLPWRVDGTSLAGRRRLPPTKQLAITDHDRIRPDRGHIYSFDGTRAFETLLRSPAAGPPGPATLRIFRSGRFGSLVARDVAGLAAGPPSRLEGRMISRSPVYDASSDRAPVYVRAHVAAEGALVAIALNGRLGAWMHSVKPNRRANVWGIVPEELLRPGRNDVRLYEITGPVARPTLHAIEAR